MNVELQNWATLRKAAENQHKLDTWDEMYEVLQKIADAQHTQSDTSMAMLAMAVIRSIKR